MLPDRFTLRIGRLIIVIHPAKVNYSYKKDIGYVSSSSNCHEDLAFLLQFFAIYSIL
jgi:hypothetical protein